MNNFIVYFALLSYILPLGLGLGDGDKCYYLLVFVNTEGEESSLPLISSTVYGHGKLKLVGGKQRLLIDSMVHSKTLVEHINSGKVNFQLFVIKSDAKSIPEFPGSPDPVKKLESCINKAPPPVWQRVGRVEIKNETEKKFYLNFGSDVPRLCIYQFTMSESKIEHGPTQEKFNPNPYTFISQQEDVGGKDLNSSGPIVTGITIRGVGEVTDYAADRFILWLASVGPELLDKVLEMLRSKQPSFALYSVENKLDVSEVFFSWSNVQPNEAIVQEESGVKRVRRKVVSVQRGEAGHLPIRLTVCYEEVL